MNRRALLSAGAVSLAGLAGCAGAARRRLSGRIEMDVATAVFHPAEEPWFVDGLAADSSDDYRADLFTESPADVDDLLTDHYPRKPRSLENDVRNADYDSEFLLLFEAKMPRDEAYSVLPTILYGDLGWTGWRAVAAPMARNPRDPETLDFADDVDELVATTLVRYAADATPSKAVVTVYDEESGGRVLRTAARPRS